jgi:hypothetical protein
MAGMHPAMTHGDRATSQNCLQLSANKYAENFGVQLRQKTFTSSECSFFIIKGVCCPQQRD